MTALIPIHLPVQWPTFETLPETLSPELWGLREGSNRAKASECQIRASHDVEAIYCWLNEYQHKITTYRSYQKEAECFWLWCVYQHQKPLSSLDRDDFKAYFDFLSNPQPAEHWCGRPGGNHAQRGTLQWKPFAGALSPSSKRTAITILHSMMEYLVQASYLKFNPISLMRGHKKSISSAEERALRVKARILTPEEWTALRLTLEELPETPAHAQMEKYRLRFIIHMLYLLGLRVSELTTHRWNAFREEQGQWWFYVTGKGDKPGKIPVNAELLASIREYRLFLGLWLFPQPTEDESLVATYSRKKAITPSYINKKLKQLAIQTGEKYFAAEPMTQQKLRGFSAHE